VDELRRRSVDCPPEVADEEHRLRERDEEVVLLRRLDRLHGRLDLRAQFVDLGAHQSVAQGPDGLRDALRLCREQQQFGSVEELAVILCDLLLGRAARDIEEVGDPPRLVGGFGVELGHQIPERICALLNRLIDCEQPFEALQQVRLQAIELSTIRKIVCPECDLTANSSNRQSQNRYRERSWQKNSVALSIHSMSDLGKSNGSEIE
jgi:hypothetical protein